MCTPRPAITCLCPCPPMWVELARASYLKLRWCLERYECRRRFGLFGLSQHILHACWKHFIKQSSRITLKRLALLESPNCTASYIELEQSRDRSWGFLDFTNLLVELDRSQGRDTLREYESPKVAFPRQHEIWRLRKARESVSSERLIRFASCRCAKTQRLLTYKRDNHGQLWSDRIPLCDCRPHCFISMSWKQSAMLRKF